jgi:hypothetical protein
MRLEAVKTKIMKEILIIKNKINALKTKIFRFYVSLNSS